MSEHKGMTAVHQVAGVTHWAYDGAPAVHYVKCSGVDDPEDPCCTRDGEEIMWHRVRDCAHDDDG